VAAARTPPRQRRSAVARTRSLQLQPLTETPLAWAGILPSTRRIELSLVSIRDTRKVRLGCCSEVKIAVVDLGFRWPGATWLERGKIFDPSGFVCRAPRPAAHLLHVREGILAPEIIPWRATETYRTKGELSGRQDTAHKPLKRSRNRQKRWSNMGRSTRRPPRRACCAIC